VDVALGRGPNSGRDLSSGRGRSGAWPTGHVTARDQNLGPRTSNSQLFMEVRHGPGDIVLDGDPAPPTHQFRCCCAASPRLSICQISSRSANLCLCCQTSSVSLTTWPIKNSKLSSHIITRRQKLLESDISSSLFAGTFQLEISLTCSHVVWHRRRNQPRQISRHHASGVIKLRHPNLAILYSFDWSPL